MTYPYTDNLMTKEPDFVKQNLMGPNVLRVTEELVASLPISPGDRVLDLGCGKGLSSLLLAEKYGAKVFAGDLWISPTENFRRFQALEADIIPLTCDVTCNIDFAEDYFSLISCVDAYHYFGYNHRMLPKLLRHVQPGGHIAVAVPGLKQTFNNGIPEELLPFWEDNMHFHTVEEWFALWSREENVEIVCCREMESHALAWKEWLGAPNPHAQNDIAMMEAEGGKYFNHVMIIGRRKNEEKITADIGMPVRSIAFPREGSGVSHYSR